MKIMKKICLLVGVVVCSIMFFENQHTSFNKVKLSNVEALAAKEEGTIRFICRCHDDNKCYSGNWASLRGLCYLDYIPDTGSIPYCHNYDSQCVPK